MNYYLSYLIGAENVTSEELQNLGVHVLETKPSGSRKLKIPAERLADYLRIIEVNLNPGFWNEVISDVEILFILKFVDGTLKKLSLNENTEKEISELCTQFNNDPIERTSNVYKYLSENEFYKQILFEHYADLINR